MQRIIIICFLIFITSSGIVVAQTDIDLTELKAPSSPAFTILGINPSDIARPKTFEALEGSLFSNFTDGNALTLPQNYALEFQPYWLVSHPGLTLDSYMNPNGGQIVAHNFSISTATMPIQNIIDTTLKATRLSFGFRTLLWQGNPLAENERYCTNIKRIDSIQNVIVVVLTYYQLAATDPTSVSIPTLITNAHAIIDAYKLQPGSDAILNKRIDKFINEFVDPFLNSNAATTNADIQTLVGTTLFQKFDESKIAALLSATVDSLSAADKDNEGFFLELAAASVLDFPTNEFSYSKFQKAGIWLTPSYRLHSQQFEFLGVLRFIYNKTATNTSNNFDFGGKLVWQKGNFSLSAEFIRRFQNAVFDVQTFPDYNLQKVTKSWDNKTVCNADYRINDKLLLTLSVGENFDLNTEYNGNLISLFSLNYGIGGPKLNSIPQN